MATWKRDTMVCFKCRSVGQFEGLPAAGVGYDAILPPFGWILYEHGEGEFVCSKECAEKMAERSR
jgi:hypothetical protein